MRSNQVYIHELINSKYPDKKDSFSPSIAFPEYKFPNDISNSENVVYEMIRECLYHMGFDTEHYGLEDWNPLKGTIKPGDTVVLKANMVMHRNEKPEKGVECLITHPSLVRAMIDYVVIALKGTGAIIVGDAPMQSCDFERLVEEQGYQKIIDFYHSKGIKVELVDFRNYKTISKNGLLQRVKNESNNKAIAVDLGKKSEFLSIDKNRYKKLRITNYDHSIIYNHHNSEKNEYLIAKKILDADVIINMPKPKTHRKAGVTISLKNLVGINTNKEWLPHHTEGSVKEGGDEYLSKSYLKKKRTYYLEKRDTYMVTGREGMAKVSGYIARGYSILIRIFRKERNSEGSWYGNDTIWRTILDLNKIVYFADKHGMMRDTRQRKMLIVADMIVSGEGEGPLLPDPKAVGMIAMGTNPVCFDEAISSIMGFQPSFIPTIKNARKVKDYDFTDRKETKIVSNNTTYHNKRPKEVLYKDSLQFRPPAGWQGHFHK
ncbi:MAG: hypothetical protein K0S01_2386 [Herbinix sp.]|jgi:uncharacterized protein (DUF362 family)|nr:hypothetical protein [Herbinix sp.]